MATTTLVTVQDFARMAEPPGLRIELIGGEVVTLGRGKLVHEAVKANLILLLAGWLSRNPIARLFAETMYQFDELTALIPDISVVALDSTAPGGDRMQGGPEIAIEVVSSETAATLERKIELYLAQGSKSAWVIFPEQRVVWIHKPGTARMLTEHDTLEDPTVLPGFSAPVSSLFEGI